MERNLAVTNKITCKFTFGTAMPVLRMYLKDTVAKIWKDIYTSLLMAVYL